MRFIERFWRRLSGGEAAERAELEGDLPRAIRLWASAGSTDEAARVMTLRGDAEPDPRARLQHYTQAVATATDGSPVHRAARAKKARLTVALAGDAALSVALRRDVASAARELEDAGELAEAADAYALAGDTEGEARTLAKSGDVDRLESLLTHDQATARRGRLLHDVHADVDALVAAGRRREALALAQGSPDDELARARATRVLGARLSGPIVRVTLGGNPLTLVLGEEVTIGRTEGDVHVGSSALSRVHARLSRAGGRCLLVDLGSRNGTQLRGLNLAHPLDVTEGTTVTLGGEVPLTLEKSDELGGALAIEVAGQRYVAPLGDAELGLHGWKLVLATDGWVELATEREFPAFSGATGLVPRVTLLRGDALSTTRGGAVVLRV